MTLNELNIGQSASIVRFYLESGPRAQLMEMGLLEGARVTLLGRAPLGDPLELRVGDFRLSLRAAQAIGIEVEKTEPV